VARAPLLPLASAFIVGILVAGTGAFGLACALGIVLLAIPRRRVLGAFVIAGALCFVLRGQPAEIARETASARVAGTVVGDVSHTDDGTSFPFALDDGTIVHAYVRGEAAAGERLIVRGRLAPLDEPRNPGEPSARAIGLAEGTGGQLSGTVLARAAPDIRDARAWSARVRAWLGRRLRIVVREPEAGILAGALWGERADVAPALRSDFQATGTVHVLVTAGLHLGVIAGLVLGLLTLCQVPRAPAALTTIAAVAAYAWLSGAHVPSERAAVMIGTALLARACGARPASWNALALAAIVVAALRPAAVASVSFALSFSCVAAIACFAAPLETIAANLRMPQRLREAFALTAATQIGVWPLSAAVFGTLAPYALLANALVVPATGAAMIAGIAALLFSAVPALGLAAGSAATLVVLVIERVVAAIAALPGARFTVAPPPLFAIVLYDAAAIVAAGMLRRSGRTAAAILAAASVVVLATTLRLPPGQLTITMLDVGQGDGIVITTPHGHTILIDSGGRLETGSARAAESPAERVGERVTLGYLRRTGVHHVALLVNTHPHGDHVGGCAPIVNALHVDAILDSGQRYSGRAFQDCMAAARRRGVPLIIAHAGMRRQLDDGVALDILAPSLPPLADTGDDVNENSIVVMLQYRAVRALFMGDAGEAAEARLLARGADLHADIIKVGHHGSRYGSTPAFAAAVHPRLALISVGRHNTFGHPAQTTVDAWNAAGASVMRTDRCGAVVVMDARIATTMIPCSR